MEGRAVLLGARGEEKGVCRGREDVWRWGGEACSTSSELTLARPAVTNLKSATTGAAGGRRENIRLE